MRITIPFIVVCALELVSCQPGSLVDIPVNPPRLVVGAQPIEGQPWQVFLSRSVPLSDPSRDPGGVPGASIKIFEGDAMIDELTTDDGDERPSEYTGSAGGPIAGHTYSIKVEAQGYESVTAHYTHPVAVDMDNFEYEVLSQSDIINEGSSFEFVQTQFRLKVTFTDPPGDNYYGLSLFRVKADSTNPGGPITIENSTMEDINTAMLDYQTQETMYGKLIDDKKFAGKTVTLLFNAYITTNIGGDQKWHSPDFIFSLSNLSKELFDYRVYGTKYGPNYYDPYAEPPSLYTNIENGYGIFAGYSRSEKSFHYEPF